MLDFMHILCHNFRSRNRATFNEIDVLSTERYVNPLYEFSKEL